MLIAVNDPQRTYWGEIAAAPAFQKVMSFTLSYFNVPPDRASGSATQGASR
jgi:cell division protein FtsI (penicillin-binding protein 3)